MRAKDYSFMGKIITSFQFHQNAFFKQKDRDLLPILARGCFVQKIGDEDYRFVARGYDKFFNIGETPETNWEYIAKNFSGPFEVTLKENGFMLNLI